MERPIKTEDVESLRSQIDSAIASSRDQTNVQFAGMELLLTREGPEEYSFGAPDEERARLFPALSTRPTSYPDGLPFVPNEAVALTSGVGGWSLSWFAPEDPAALTSEIHERLIEDGWTSAHDLIAGSVHRLYRRGPEQRLLANSQGIIALMTRTTGPSSGTS